jgi:transposase, IS30 family
MIRYKQLGQEQRYVIGRLYAQGKTQTEMALALGCSKSTICRELRRNMPQRGIGAKQYDANKAQQRAEKRHTQKPKRQKFTHEMKQQIVKWMVDEKLSPELMAVKGRATDPDFVSAETIYKWIWKMKHSHRRENSIYNTLYQELKHGRRRHKRGNYHQNRGCIPDRVPIDKRPKIVEKRQRIGDLEIDLMMGIHHKPGLLVITDRATLKTALKKITTKSSKQIAKAIIHKLKPNEQWIKTLTYDNDLAFAAHCTVNQALDTESYFTRPYSSQDKGTVENRIGLLRQFFPKKTDFSKITHQEVRKVEKIINDRPVRKFGYKTPNEIFLRKARVAVIT